MNLVFTVGGGRGDFSSVPELLTANKMQESECNFLKSYDWQQETEFADLTSCDTSQAGSLNCVKKNLSG
jgi:hypothetical protein